MSECKIHLVAKPEHYHKYNNGYKLSSSTALPLPGAITSNPELGSKQYNEALISYLSPQNDKMKNRIDIIFEKFKNNRRVLKLQNIIIQDKCSVFPGQYLYNLPTLKLSSIEKYLLIQYFSFNN